MKRLFASAFAVVAVCGIAFADVHVNFYNKLYSEDPIVRHHDDDKNSKYETDVYFPGVKERMYADIKTDKVDAGVKGTMYFKQKKGPNDFYFDGSIDDWWVEFRPIDMLTLGLHDSIWADGSYLPIWDDNVSAGNIGSDGFTAVFRLLPGLRLAATIPSGIGRESNSPGYNWLSGDSDDFHFGTGAIFDAGVFQVSANLQDIPCSGHRQFGTYINMPGLFGMVKELTIGGGFAHAWGEGFLSELISQVSWARLWYENLMSVYATYDAGTFGLSAEIAFNFEFDDIFGYDFYTAVAVSFGLMDKLTATVTGKLLHDFADNGLDNGYGASFAVDYEVNKQNMIGAKAEVNLIDDYWDFAVPVYWKYTFAY